MYFVYVRWSVIWESLLSIRRAVWLPLFPTAFWQTRCCALPLDCHSCAADHQQRSWRSSPRYLRRTVWRCGCFCPIPPDFASIYPTSLSTLKFSLTKLINYVLIFRLRLTWQPNPCWPTSSYPHPLASAIIVWLALWFAYDCSPSNPYPFWYLRSCSSMCSAMRSPN